MNTRMKSTIATLCSLWYIYHKLSAPEDLLRYNIWDNGSIDLYFPTLYFYSLIERFAQVVPGLCGLALGRLSTWKGSAILDNPYT